MRMKEILDVLGDAERARVSFVGAGGKTSCILALARSWSAAGAKTLVCTTTHMETPEFLGVRGCIDRDAEETWKELERQGWIVGGRRSSQEGKIQTLAEETWIKLEQRADRVLIEADGSRKLPVKAPGEREPVIRQETTHILLLAGASALLKPLEQVCHRPEEARKLLERGGRREEQVLTAGLLGFLLEEGYVKKLRGLFPEKRLALVLNQAELLDRPGETLEVLKNCVSVPVFLHSKREEQEIQGILLAAGFSRRFGENKLLLEFQRKPLYFHVLDRLEELFREGELQGLRVVTQYGEIVEEMRRRGLPCVENRESEKGISSSLKLGLSQAQKAGDGGKERYYMFFTGDQPFLRKETIREFLKSFLESGKRIGCVSQKGETGNPVIFHQDYAPELLSLKGDRGGKQVVKRHWEDVFFYEVEAEELRDFDFKEDMREQGVPCYKE